MAGADPADAAAGRGDGGGKGMSIALAERDAHHAAAATAAPARLTWHIVTGEFPPQPGGVSDYTEMVARGLADAGDAVVVWAPAGEASCCCPGVEVRRVPGRFGPAALSRISVALRAEPGPYRLLIQYVPHAFGWKAANLPFCAWLRLQPRGTVWVMFHEVAYPFERGDTLGRNALALVNRLMARLVGRAASRVFVSIPAWRDEVTAMASPDAAVRWLPVPSAIPVIDDAAAHAAIRDRYARGRALVGHFGTYGSAIRAALDASLPELVARIDCSVVLLGRGSEVVARDIAARHPSMRGRLFGTGALPAADVSRHLGACDVMMQPYPDGISSRRTSAMAALAHGRPLVTTIGPLSEPLWRESGAAILVDAGEIASLAPATASLLASAARRAALSARATAAYGEWFDVSHTIRALRAA
jgi:glycosyltransferase involved in cell wall biosynthesis